MDKDAERCMTRARISLITNQPFFGMLSMRLQLIEDATIKPATMRTNGRWIKYHPGWVKNNTTSKNVFVIGHEVGHCMFDHMGRRKGRNPHKWNRACDYVVNLALAESGMAVPEDALYDKKYTGMSADEVYNLLPDEPGDNTGGSGSSGFDGVDDAPPTDSDDGMTPEQLADDWKVATLSAANAAKGQGALPAAIQRLVDQITKPQNDWRHRLRQFITQRARDDYSFARVNRRYAALGIYLPGLYSETMGTMVAISDDSGSIGQKELSVFSAEVAAARDAAMPETTYVLSCDARVNWHAELDKFQPMKLESHGGGGTDFRPPFTWLEERGIRPDVLIYLTDGYGTFPDKPADFPVLWCMTTDVKAPWGETLKVDLSEYDK